MSDPTTEQRLHVDANPCTSCPYRTDTPCGVWDASEYDKLPTYDEPSYDPDTGSWPEPNLHVFLCHHSRLGRDDTVCRGWLSVHRDSIAVRLATLTGTISLDDANAEVTVELYETGAAAAEAGRRDLSEVDEAGRALIDRIEATRLRQRARNR